MRIRRVINQKYRKHMKIAWLQTKGEVDIQHINVDNIGKSCARQLRKNYLPTSDTTCLIKQRYLQYVLYILCSQQTPFIVTTINLVTFNLQIRTSLQMLTCRCLHVYWICNSVNSTYSAVQQTRYNFLLQSQNDSLDTKDSIDCIGQVSSGYTGSLDLLLTYRET